MKSDYAEDVARYASARLKDRGGNAINVSHSQDIDPVEVKTDGVGNVISCPLVYRKDCWGRLERHARGHFGVRQWPTKTGERQFGETACTRCAERSPGVYETCSRIVDERLGSSAAIQASMGLWLDACGGEFGRWSFAGHRGKLWREFLQAIADHGGWTNFNDIQVKVEAIRLAEEKQKRRNATAKASRQRDRQARLGKAAPTGLAYMQAVQDERDERAAWLKRLGSVSGPSSKNLRWLKLPPESCERLADVWMAREILTRSAHKVTGRAIAEWMITNRRGQGLSCASLTTRVLDDLKRIRKLEANIVGAPIWEQRVFAT